MPEKYEQRLQYSAHQAGPSRAFYIKKIIVDHLEDLEDVYLAEHRLEQLREGKDEIVSSEQFWSGLGDQVY